jgi:hypothetical protein
MKQMVSSSAHNILQAHQTVREEVQQCEILATVVKREILQHPVNQIQLPIIGQNFLKYNFAQTIYTLKNTLTSVKM